MWTWPGHTSPAVCRVGKVGVNLARVGGGPPLLKTFPAVDRSSLSWFKGNGRLFPTLSAYGRGFDPMVALPGQSLTPLHFTRLATFGFVSESLVREKKLLPRSENELRSTVATLQDPIPVLHSHTPLREQGPTP